MRVDFLPLNLNKLLPSFLDFKKALNYFVGILAKFVNVRKPRIHKFRSRCKYNLWMC